jgi:Zn-dependent protease
MGVGGRGGPQQPRKPLPPRQRYTIIAAVIVVVVAVLVRTNRVSRVDVIYFCVLVPSIIIHEISHGWVALAFGDDTAKRAGRLSLNPIRHVDPVGTLLVPGVLSLVGFGAYGWAKPVPVNTAKLRSPRNQSVIVSLTGPLTNFALAAILGGIYVATTPAPLRQAVDQLGVYPPTLGQQILFIAGIANIILGIFNLIPCPPLDGAALLERLLPARILPEYYQLQPFLMFLPFLLILIFHRQWSEFIGHVINWWAGLLA